MNVSWEILQLVFIAEAKPFFAVQENIDVLLVCVLILQ